MILSERSQVRARLTSLIAVAALSVLTACGGGNKSLLSTSSIFGGKAAKVAAPGNLAVPEDPSARPIQVGWVSARAIKCGFYFDPDRLKQTFLAAEAQRGITDQELRKIELTYTFSLKSTAGKIAEQDTDVYCNKKQAAAIRKDLQRHLAGDFTPTSRVPEKEQSFWSLPESKTKKMNPNAIFDPDWE